jgi:acyl-CoA hydrolase
VSNITFMEPIKAGDAVCCYTDVVRVGQTSMTLHVDVWVLRQGQGDRVKVTAAEFVFVAVNDNGRPRSVSSGSLPAIPAPESPRVNGALNLTRLRPDRRLESDPPAGLNK